MENHILVRIVAILTFQWSRSFAVYSCLFFTEKFFVLRKDDMMYVI